MLKQIALGMVLLASLLAGTAWADEALNKALFDAAKGEDSTVVMVLISKGADVNAKGEDGESPLHKAIQIKGYYPGHKEIIEILLSKGANVNVKGIFGRTPLHIASTNEGTKEVAELLISKGADVNAKENNGNTPLHWAASREVAELLIAKGADVNAKDAFGMTPLHEAAHRSKEVAEILISKGADVNARGKYGSSPLHEAASWANKETAELLISKGADLNAKDIHGETPLQKAAELKKNEVFALLQVAVQKYEEKMATLLQTALQNQSGNQREIFNRVMVNYKDRAMSDDIRRPFIALAAKLKPAPAVPEEARKYLIRGNALMQDAKNPGEARAAIQEYQNALLAAPWWDDAYYNLSKAQELAGDLDGAYSSMQYYTLTEPQDKREAQDRLYALEAKRDKAKGK